jgi:hypothetical protein
MAYLAVASAVALQLSGTIHLAVVPHAICAEHGEAMDVGEDAHGHATALPASDRDEAQVATDTRTRPIPPEGDSHHHCPLDEDRNTHALVVYAAAIHALLASPVALAAPRVEPVRPSSRELHRLAPKTSPPV